MDNTLNLSLNKYLRGHLLNELSQHNIDWTCECVLGTVTQGFLNGPVELIKFDLGTSPDMCHVQSVQQYDLLLRFLWCSAVTVWSQFEHPAHRLNADYSPSQTKQVVTLKPALQKKPKKHWGKQGPKLNIKS